MLEEEMRGRNVNSCVQEINNDITKDIDWDIEETFLYLTCESLRFFNEISINRDINSKKVSPIMTFSEDVFNFENRCRMIILVSLYGMSVWQQEIHENIYPLAKHRGL